MIFFGKKVLLENEQFDSNITKHGAHLTQLLIYMYLATDYIVGNTQRHSLQYNYVAL